MDSQSTYYRRWGKRLFDVLVSVTALVVLSPLLVLIAILVRVFLGSPVLFRQTRSGHQQKPFTILKFRTMTDERDAAGNSLSDSVRLTPLGRFLRATSLDELPELVNVVCGDMTLVGPRPLHNRYDAWYRAEEMKRFDVRPGITGWAQINGRNALSWDRRFEYDVWYVGACGFWLDLKILFLTVGKVVRRENVQVNTDLTVPSLDDERREQKADSLSSLPKTRSETNEKPMVEPVNCLRCKEA